MVVDAKAKCLVFLVHEEEARSSGRRGWADDASASLSRQSLLANLQYIKLSSTPESTNT